MLLIFNWVIFRFQVNFPGCIPRALKMTWSHLSRFKKQIHPSEEPGHRLVRFSLHRSVVRVEIWRQKHGRIRYFTMIPVKISIWYMHGVYVTYIYIWCSVAHPPPLWMGHGPPPPPVVVGLWWGSACFWCCWLSLVSSASPPPCGCVDGSWWWWRCWKYVYKYLCVYEYIYMYMYMMKWICTYNHMYIYVYIYTYVIMFMNMYVYGYVSSPPLWCG